tara:strand:- start:136 stop:912 length:777 start_codon:yes stop_codon:yes gene_type:complete
LLENKNLSLLVDAALASGEIAKSFFRKQPETWEKDDKSGPVTEADIAINRMLKAELLFNRPDFGWLSEETEDSSERLSYTNVFIVDPIDGTRSFISGKNMFSHSLAISRNGNIVAGVVYLPILNLMYTASETNPSELNGKQIETSKTKKFENSRVLTTIESMNSRNWRGIPPNVNIAHRSSLAYRLCLVAEGHFDAILTFGKCWEWDIAAGDIIIKNAGGRFTDKFNKSITFNKPDNTSQGCIGAGDGLHKIICSEMI